MKTHQNFKKWLNGSSTLSITIKNVTLSIWCHYAEYRLDERHNAECHYAERHYAECHYANVIMMSVIILSVITVTLC